MPSRRQLLAASGGLLTALAGCGSDDAETDAGTPTATDRGTTTTQVTDSSLTVGVERRAYLFSATLVPRSVIGPQEHETTTLSELNDATRTAVRTAITNEQYTTSDPSLGLLEEIVTVPLVEYRGTYYEVSHTFPPRHSPSTCGSTPKPCRRTEPYRTTVRPSEETRRSRKPF